ncbi:MAG: hypothetical protein JWM74_5013 [Myxococcaceae bacterium]|nr:hypothetical protein [Myxococcaceae bacterium]
MKGDPQEVECPTCEAARNDQCTELPKRRSHSNRMGTSFHAGRVLAADAFVKTGDRGTFIAAGVHLFGAAWTIRGASAEQLREVDMLVEDTEGVE